MSLTVFCGVEQSQYVGKCIVGVDDDGDDSDGDDDKIHAKVSFKVLWLPCPLGLRCP